MLRPLLCFLVLLLPVRPAWAQTAEVDFFEKKIRPVLVEQCYSCHSAQAKKNKGGLFLDSKAGVLKGGDSGSAIAPGKPAESLLIKAVRYDDPELRMPPKGKMSAQAIADLEKWVKMGAPDPRGGAGPALVKESNVLDKARTFWAYQPPKKPALPDVKDRSWAAGTIDRLLLEKLEAKGLKPGPDADRATLLRRVYFNLIGLPPTPRQIDDFVSDKSAGAFAKVVDELLASPHFGERWGRHWLDVARFAESSGGGRSLLFKDAWRYRDYVIAAFNSDKPYNRFILEQIAGDLLRADTTEERRMELIATAFLLLGPTNYENQDKPILEMDMIDEQLDTMGRVFLGMTIGCARCHDHKFDPIPQADYYALAGILRSTKMIIHENVSRWTEQPLPMSAAEEKVMAKHEAVLAALKEKLQLAQAAEKALGKNPSTIAGRLSVAELPGIVIDDAQAKKIGNWKHSTFSGNYVGEGYLYDDRAHKGEKTLTFIPDFAKRGTFEVRLAYVPHVNRATNVPVRVFHADGETTVHVNQRKVPTDGHFVSLGTYRFEKGSQYFVMVLTDGADGHVAVDAVQFLPEDLKLSAPPVTAKPGQPARGFDAKALAAELKRLQANGPQRPTTMAVSEGARIEDCHLCIRGNFHNRGPKVPRGFLQALTPPGSEKAKLAIPAKESGRRQLAEWLASPDNPLTARVMVNRLWHHTMGVGLVRTVDNFGFTGELPSHPELLDYLALRFVEQGWSVKKLIREIVLSRAFQMSSDQPANYAAVQKIDPENRLFWHMNRRRLDAEVIRDTILLVSGDLDLTAGGSLLGKDTLERNYQFEDKRRSVYTPVFRNRLLELLEAFDFADPNISLGKRTASTVSTQALYMMNSPFVMEQASRAAQKLLADPAVKDDEGRVELAYRQALGRLPTAREKQLAVAFVGSAAADRRAAAWAEFYQTLFACVDFRYMN